MTDKLAIDGSPPVRAKPPPVIYRMGMCPRTEDLVSRSFIVGVGPAFSPEDCEDVATSVAKVATHLL